MITETMKVCEVLDLNSAFEEIFLAHGLNCAGCPGSTSETLAEAAEGHGIDLDRLLEHLNAAISKQ